MKKITRFLVSIMLVLCLMVPSSVPTFAASHVYPSFPSGAELTITADKTSLTVAWPAATDAVKYDVALDSKSNIVAANASNPTTITGLESNKLYFIYVIATSSTGDSRYIYSSVKTLSNTPSVDSVVQTGATANSIDIAIAGTNCVRYVVSYYPGYSYELETFAGETTGPISLVGLAQGTKYTVKVTGYNDVGEASSTKSETFETLVGNVTNLKLDEFYHFAQSAQMSWDEQSAADGYEYILKDSKGKEVYHDVTTFSKVDLSVKANHVYTFYVRAYKNGVYTDYSEILVFEQAWVKAANVKKGKLTVSWEKQKGACGYEVYVSTKQNKGYKKVASTKKNSVTIKKFNKKKFKKKKTYWIYIVTKVKHNGQINRSGLVYVWKTGAGSSHSYY